MREVVVVVIPLLSINKSGFDYRRPDATKVYSAEKKQKVW